MELSDEEFAELSDLFLEEETGSTGFVGYMKLHADSGVSFGRATRPSSDQSATISGALAWLYWAIEFGIIAFLGVNAARKASIKPFSEAENEWFSKRQYIGTVQNGLWGDLKHVMEQGDFATAATKIVYDTSIPVPRTDVIVLYAGEHSDDVAISFEAVKPGKNSVDRNNVYYGLITRAELSQIMPQMPETTEV